MAVSGYRAGKKVPRSYGMWAFCWFSGSFQSRWMRLWALLMLHPSHPQIQR